MNKQERVVSEEVRIMRRRVEVAELRLKGWTFQRIADKIGVTNVTACNDMKAVEEMWRDACVKDYQVLVGREEHRIVGLIEAYRKEFRKSCYKLVQSKGKNGQNEVKKVRVPGNIEYLDGMKDCIEKLWKLYGLARDTTINNTQNNLQVGGAQQVNSGPPGSQWAMLYQAPNQDQLDPVEQEIAKALEEAKSRKTDPLAKLEIARLEEKLGKHKANGQNGVHKQGEELVDLGDKGEEQIEPTQ